jgi:osmotically-inducible protein OsmY
MNPTDLSNRCLAIAAVLATAWVVAPASASQPVPRAFGYTNVLTVAGVDADSGRIVARDAGEVQITIHTDETTSIQDARGAEIALAALEPWDRVVVDGRDELEGRYDGDTLVADRVQLVVGSPGAYRADEERHERDAALRDRVVERLAASRSLQGSDVWVSVMDGHVTLHGRVADEAAEHRAVELARRTPGTRGLTNELRTDPSLLEWISIQREDEVLAREVAERLVAEAFPNARLEEDWIFGWEVEADAFELDVDADMGTVTLTGQVPSSEDVERAIAVARRTPGVRNVRAVLDHE